MSWSGDQSPKPRNSPDWSQGSGQYGNFRSPYPSPRNGHDFGGHSPMKKNFGWRNSGGYHRFPKDRFHFSPGGSRRGGGGQFRGRGGGHFRGSPTDGADISLYVNPSMLSDPWKELEETLDIKVTPRVSLHSEPSVPTTPNSSISTTLNTSASNDDTKENVTEESIVISDDSSGNVSVSEQTVPDSVSDQTVPDNGDQSEKTSEKTIDP